VQLWVKRGPGGGNVEVEEVSRVKQDNQVVASRQLSRVASRLTARVASRQGSKEGLEAGREVLGSLGSSQEGSRQDRVVVDQVFGSQHGVEVQAEILVLRQLRHERAIDADV
jgi:hypothetical protein